MEAGLSQVSDSDIALWAVQHRDDPGILQAVLDELERRLDSLQFGADREQDRRIEILETYYTLLTVEPRTETPQTSWSPFWWGLLIAWLWPFGCGD